MNCQEARKLVEDAVDNNVVGSARRRLDLHLMRCRSCREFFAAEKREHAEWFALLNDPSRPTAKPPADFVSRLVARARAAERPWYRRFPRWGRVAAIVLVCVGLSSYAAWTAGIIGSKAERAENALESLASEGSLGSLEAEGSLGSEVALESVEPEAAEEIAADPIAPNASISAAQISTTENNNTEKEETMNLKSITKATAKLAVGAALTTGLAANAVADGNLPDDCTLLEYVQGNGSAYLITDYTPDPSQDTIIVDVDLVAGQGFQTIFCARDPSTGVNTWSLLRLADGTLRYDFGSASSGNRYVSPVVSSGRHRITADQNGLSVDGKAVSLSGFKTEEFTPGGPLWLFAMPWEGSTNYSSMKLRSLAILRGGDVLKFYLPIKDVQDHATVCDILGESLVTQAGTGFLVAGPETENWASSVLSKEPTQLIRYAGFGNAAPLKVKVVDAITGEDLVDGVDYSLSCVGAMQVGYAQLTVTGMGRYYGCGTIEKLPVLAKLPRGYTQVESVDSTGTEYVDLDLYLTGKTDFFMDCDLLSPQKDGEGYPSPFGARVSDAAMYKLTVDKDMADWTLSYGGSQVWVSRSGLGSHTFESAPTRRRYLIDGNEFSMTISPSLAVDASAYLFAFNDLKDQPSGVTANAVHLAKMKLFAFALWDDGVLKRDLVPCKTDQGVYGLYDLVSKHFFGNASKTGAFTGGLAMPNLPCQGTMILIY